VKVGAAATGYGKWGATVTNLLLAVSGYKIWCYSDTSILDAARRLQNWCLACESVTDQLACAAGTSLARAAAMPGRLRVAIVAASLRILGGQAVQAQRMLDGWRDDSHVAAWLVPINPLPPGPFRSLLAVKFVRTVVTQLCYWPLLVRELRRADVVHVFSASYASFLLAPLPAILIARLLNRPVILNYHSGEAPDHLRRSPLARFVLKRCVDRNIVPSTFLRDVLDSFGIAAQVVPNTVDLSRFVFRPRDPLRPRLLSTRNFEPLYNVACTLRAFARIQQRYPEASLTLVGAGSEEHALRLLAADLRLQHVVFAGRVPAAEVHRYYADADLYVQSSAIDNMPLSVLEAFASGLPVVATRVGGVPAMLTDGVHGALVEDDDDAGLATAVIRLIEQPAYARQLAATARATCAAYQWSVVRDQWLAAYRSVGPAGGGNPTTVSCVEPPTGFNTSR
jgi:glycosyltransferase involved in cell wall biosynthesis